MSHYWEWAMAPCRISDELYYVGTRKGPAQLLVTSDGLVLIDTCHPKSLYMLLENMRTLGFDYHDVRHIVHSHGHWDHFGGTRALVELCGAKTYIGKEDADAVRGLNNLAAGAAEVEEFFEPDVLLDDGDVVTFGDTPIRFVSTPGHTRGTKSIFLTLHDGGKPYRAGMFGGAGLNTLSRKYLDGHGLPLSYRDDYIASIDRLLGEKVEIHLGNHVRDNNHLEKMRHIGEGKNPFIDPASWETFLRGKRAEALELFRTDP